MGGGSIIEHGRGLHVRYELRGRRQNVVTYAMQLQQRNDSNAPVNNSVDHPRYSASRLFLGLPRGGRVAAKATRSSRSNIQLLAILVPTSKPSIASLRTRPDVKPKNAAASSALMRSCISPFVAMTGLYQTTT